MNKRERLEAAIAGQATDRTPIAFWRHFPGDDQAPETLAVATIAFQRRWDFDFVKVTPASSFEIKDWGAQDVWLGNIEGTRKYVHHPIEQPGDWKGLKALDPRSGALGEQLRCLKQIVEGLPDTPVIQTIFNPLSQAKNLAGDRLMTDLRHHVAAVQAVDVGQQVERVGHDADRHAQPGHDVLRVALRHGAGEYAGQKADGLQRSRQVAAGRAEELGLEVV